MKIIKNIWSYRKGKWALTILMFFGVMVLLGDFISNDKPVYCKYEGQSYFPVFHQYGQDLGMVDRYKFLGRKSWYDLELDQAIYPVIKFSSNSIDSKSTSFSKPGTKIKSGLLTKTHWLGSDGIGRDVAAGIVQGSQKTFLIAFLSMLISCIVGFLLGVLSGFYGDDTLRFNLWLLPVLIFGLGFIFFQWLYGHWSFWMMKGIALIYVILIVVFNRKLKSKQVNMPFDIIVMRCIEIFKSVPTLFILLALLAIISKPSLLTLVIILGLLRWSTIARVLRAELLKLKTKDFVISAHALGHSNIEILKNHILPNALPPLLTILAFGFAGVILLEATISFLGIGLSAEDVTWGSILSEARNNFSAWWLAVFPGLAIFLTVVACNYLGDTLNEINLKSA